MPTDKDEFLNLLRKSKVIAPSKLDPWLNVYNCDDAKKLAVRLIDAGLLTNWQAKYLLSGKHRLRFGSYVLLERVSRDLNGDRFVGIHKQLNRKVDILFLSSEFSKESMRLNDLIRQIGNAADIDHPNLEHIYDIDQHENRYFLVTEHISGQPIVEMHRATPLDSLQLAKIVRQIVDAIHYAHRHGVIHGGLGESDMILDSNRQIKIRNIVLTFLTRSVRPVSDWSAAKPIDDWRAVSRIAGGMLEHLPLELAVGDCRELARLFVAIGTDDVDPASILHSLDQWLSVNDPPQPNSPSLAAMEVNLASQPHESPSAPDVANDPMVPRRTSGKEITGRETGSKSRLSQWWFKTPLLTVAIAVGVMLLGGVLFLSGMFSAGDKQTPTRARTWNPPLTPPIEQPSTPATHRFKNEKAINLSKPKEPTSEQPDDPSTHETQPAPAEPKDRRIPLDESTIAEPAHALEQAPELPEYRLNPPQDEAVAASDRKKDVSADNMAANLTDPQPSNPLSMVAEKLPFEDLSDAVDIQLACDAGEKSLGPVYAFGNHLMLAELIWDESLARGRVRFELKRTATDKQRWDVIFKKREDDDGTAIAQFARTGDQLTFAWQANASENEYSDYLRNAILKLQYPGHLKKLRLRKPVLIQGFQLSAENPQQQSDAAVAWLPKNVVAAVSGLSPDKYGILYFEPESQTFDRRQALRIFLDAVDRDRMVSLRLEIDVRKKIRLSVQLQLHLVAGARPEVANPQRMDEARNILAQFAELKTQQYTMFDNMKTDDVREHFGNKDITYEQKKEFVKQQQEEMELAKNRLEIFNGYAERLGSFFSEPLPVVVYFELAGERVVVATTTRPIVANLPGAKPVE